MTDDLTPPHWSGDDIAAVIERIQSHGDVPIGVISDAITAIRADNSDLRARVAQLEMAAKSSGKVIVDMAGLPTPSADFMAAMMPAFEVIAVQEMQKQVDGLEAERDAALARESAAYARGVQAALHEFDTGTEWMEIRDAIRALASTPPAPVVRVKPLVREELENIEKQLHVNEGYFDGSQRTTLEILQGHIKDSVARIRAALKGRDA